MAPAIAPSSRGPTPRPTSRIATVHDGTTTPGRYDRADDRRRTARSAPSSLHFVLPNSTGVLQDVATGGIRSTATAADVLAALSAVAEPEQRQPGAAVHRQRRRREARRRPSRSPSSGVDRGTVDRLRRRVRSRPRTRRRSRPASTASTTTASRRSTSRSAAATTSSTSRARARRHEPAHRRRRRPHLRLARGANVGRASTPASHGHARRDPGHAEHRRRHRPPHADGQRRGLRPVADAHRDAHSRRRALVDAQLTAAPSSPSSASRPPASRSRRRAATSPAASRSGRASGNDTITSTGDARLAARQRGHEPQHRPRQRQRHRQRSTTAVDGTSC